MHQSVTEALHTAHTKTEAQTLPTFADQLSIAEEK